MTRALPATGIAAVLTTLALALTACGGSATTTGNGLAPGTDPTFAGAVPTPRSTATPLAAGSTASPSACPATPPKPSTAELPLEVPTDLPLPPRMSVSEVKHQEGGLTVVRFSTTDSLREGILFVLKQLPEKGFVLGRGDAEAVEADAPFTRGTLRGVLRMVATQACYTDWLLAVADSDKQGGPPVLPQYSPSATSSPLPFG